jgi:hypothetical protein
MTDWLPEFVAHHMALQSAKSPATQQLLAQAGGMRLFGTIGADIFLRPDGSTRALIEGGRDEPDRWEENSASEHLSALVIATKAFPELARLLPQRPIDADTCTACGGSGRIHGIVCGTCSGLGWRNAAAI